MPYYYKPSGDKKKIKLRLFEADNSSVFGTKFKPAKKLPIIRA
jgi:hypothetical protein